MIAFHCFRCLHISVSPEGNRCLHCDNYEAGTIPNFENCHQLERETENTSPGYYVPAADASTQTTEEDFLLLTEQREASCQASDEDFRHLQKIETNENDSVVPSEPSMEMGETTTYDCQEKNYTVSKMAYHTPNICLQDFNQDSVGKENLFLSNQNMCNNTFLAPNSYNPMSSCHLLGSVDKFSIVPQQLIHPCMQSSPVLPVLESYQKGFIYANHSRDSRDKYIGSTVSFSAATNPFSVDSRTENNFLAQTTNSNEQPSEIECTGFVSYEIIRKKGIINATAQKVYICGKCRLKFSSETVLNTHMQKHIDPLPFKCDKCDKKYSHESNLKNHYRIHNREKAFKCYKCDETFTWEYALRDHLRRQHK